MEDWISQEATINGTDFICHKPNPDSLWQKERDAIRRLKSFVPKNGEPYYLCYSGGKDSDVIRILAQLADVPHELHHNLTTVDAPETIAYLKTIPGLIIDKARYADGTPKTMWNLIPKKMMPPTRIARWCCSELKEAGGKGRLKITGVRWAESVARAKRSGMVQIIGKPKTTQKFLEENEIEHRVNKQGGVVLNMDNADTRRAVEHCYRTTSTMVNPIIDWTDEDVWHFFTITDVKEIRFINVEKSVSDALAARWQVIANSAEISRCILSIKNSISEHSTKWSRNEREPVKAATHGKVEPTCSTGGHQRTLTRCSSSRMTRSTRLCLIWA